MHTYIVYVYPVLTDRSSVLSTDVIQLAHATTSSDHDQKWALLTEGTRGGVEA
jgi:hypothetical protein